MAPILPNWLGMLWKSPNQSKWDKFYVAMTRRPRKEEQAQAGLDTFKEYTLPPHPIAFRDMYNLARLQVNVRTSVKHLTWELVRRGLEWKPLWTAKCITCGSVFHEISAYLPCPECGGELIAPDPKEYEWAQGKVENCNMNHQHLISVIEALSEDHHTVDEGYLLIRKEYSYTSNGFIAMGRVKEILRASPVLVRPVANPKTGLLGWSLYVCPEHRRQPLDLNVGGEEGYSIDIPSEKIHKCPVCKKAMYPVHYVSLKNEGGEPEDYYIEGEIINRHIYGSGMLYGTPPLMTLWPIAAALFYQECYIRDSYERKRIPNGALVVNTSNANGFFSFWKKIMAELKNDPLFIPVVPLETEPGNTGAGKINFVKFMDNLKEMDYIATRDEFRSRIASFYGVSSMFMSDTRQTGQGMLNEGSQLVVSSRSIERIQKVWNEYYLPRLSQMLGVRNWVLQVQPTEDRDLLKDLQKEQLQMQVNQMYTTIGYKSEQDPYDGQWFHKKDFAQELAETISVYQTLLTAFSGGMGMGMGDGQGGMGGAPPPQSKGGKDKQNQGKMQTYTPNADAVQKGEMSHDEQLKRGTEEEMKEHGKTREDAEKIARDHLGEDKDYYNKLESVGLLKAKAPGTPSQGTTNISTPSTIQSPKGSQGTPATSHTRNAPGMPHTYQCPYCGQPFNDKSELGGHIKSRHGGRGDPEQEKGMQEAGMTMLPEPNSMLEVLHLMSSSQMFDQNIMSVLEGALNMQYPELEEGNVGGKGTRAEMTAPVRREEFRNRKYS